ncbi:putative bifunctional diguanylate cyclase/phosphodiesterase [Spongisporangium articulatum]|uniref:Bifunctional diguanylate cyclase/phosphodiesterase n=1 Tax=Spongisporangium articulatum TaxID=3362603 RepID=A0ABW8AL74_9ACTN
MGEPGHGRHASSDAAGTPAPAEPLPVRAVPGPPILPRRWPWAQLVMLGTIAMVLLTLRGQVGEAGTNRLESFAVHLRDGLRQGREVLVLFAGVETVLAGIFLLGAIWLQRRPGADSVRVRFAMGVTLSGSAMLITGAGQEGLDPGPWTAAGVVVSLIGTVVVLSAVLGNDHGSESQSLPRLRVVLDAAAFGGASGFAAWQLVLSDGSGDWTSDQLASVFLVFVDASFFALVLLATLRQPRTRLWPAVIGLGLHTAADIVVVFSSPRPAQLQIEVLPALLWCAAVPLVAFGVLRYRRPAENPSVRDARDAASSQLSAGLVVALILVGMTGRTDVDPDAISILLLAEVLVLLGLREGIDALLQLWLTRGLREQALRDLLTGLPNRRALIERIADVETRSGDWVVLTLDLDGFKEINDLYGHRAADDLLIAVGRVLRTSCPPYAMPARIGGDEFAVLAPGGVEEGRALAYLLQSRLRGVLDDVLPGLVTSACVGVGRLVSGAARPGEDDGELAAQEAGRHELTALVESGAALRAAKAEGPDSVEVYAGQVAADRERRLALEGRLRAAIPARRIRTVAQPIVDLKTRRITGFEVLARWRDDELGEISPVEFIAIAEETGLVVELGAMVLIDAVEQAAAAGVFAAGATVAVNVSPIQLRVPGFADLVRDQLARHGVPPYQLVIEVTEAVLVTEDDPALRALKELNGRGVKVAIDDFGTGYSALGYLRRLPVQVLKIDKSLTSSLLHEPKTTAIVSGVVAMAHKMGISVVMEGIEEELEAESCLAIEADRGQGWLYGRPAEWFQIADALRLERATVGAGAGSAAVADIPAPRSAPAPALEQATAGDDVA